MTRPAILLAILLTLSAAAAEDVVSNWQGFRRLNFESGGKPCFITLPTVPAPGKPWIWRTSFPDFHAELDLELLRRGCAVAHIDCLNMLGCDAALDLMDGFYAELTTGRGYSPRPALEAVSRGGLHAYRYAARHPQRIACIYADTPVMDLKSWPLGWPDATRETADALRFYQLRDTAALEAFRGNPVDLLEPLAKARVPLRHVISLNDRVVPPAANTLEARRRLRLFGHDLDLVSVDQGTEASHGHHFTLPAVEESTRFVMRHTSVLPKGSDYFQVRDGLANCRARFERDKQGRVGFLGGSITCNPGWRDAVMRDLELRFPQTRFEFIAAGIPSMGSVPHAFRLQRDILAGGPPDLVFVEAAVNDHNHDGDPRAGDLALRGMEGVVRHLRRIAPLGDVVELHFVHDCHLAGWGRGEAPFTIAAHERVAAHYGCPSLNLSQEVAERIAAGQFTWAEDFRDLHPSPFGQQLYANSIARLLDATWPATAAAAKPHPLPPPLDPASYDHGRLMPVAAAKIIRGFVIDPEWQPADGKPTRDGFVGVPALTAATAGAEFEFTIDGTAAGLLIASGPDAGTIICQVDDGPQRPVDTVTPWSKSLHLPWALVLADGLPPGKHRIRIRIRDGALRVFHLLENQA